MKVIEDISTFDPGRGFLKEWNVVTGEVQNNTSLSYGYPFSTLVSRSYGSNLPDWRERLRLHQGAVTDLSVIEKTGTLIQGCKFSMYTPPTAFYKWANRRFELWGNYCPTSAPANLLERDLVHADNEAKADYLKSINQKFRSLQGLVTLGEIAETVGLILKPGKTIVRLSERFKRDAQALNKAKGNSRQPNRGKRTSRAFSDLWLEYSFGIAPLVGDIDSAMLGLAQIINRDIPVERVSGSGQLSSSSSVIGGGASSGVSWDLIQTIETRGGVRYYGEVALSQGAMQSFSRQFGLDFLSVVPAAWELVPWSFLIDYFTNIGEVLESLSAPQSSVLWNAKGYILTKDVTIKQTNFRAPARIADGWIITSTVGSELRVRSRILKRVPNPGYVLPTFEFPSISRYASSWKKQANTLALLISKVRS